MDIKSQIKELASTYLAEITSIRRHLHSNPELSFREYNTSAYIENFLRQEGINEIEKYVNTGISAIIRGGRNATRTIALRADIDALPIQEENEVEYASQNNGVMHACGHDVHTSSLLGVAKILIQLKEHLPVHVQLIFQPGEERLPGGASLMIKEGVFEKTSPEFIYGQHVFPDLPSGMVGFKPGMYMASCDELYMTVKGKGGHAAIPHQNIDPVLITAHILTGLQQIVSRNSSPEIPTVLSFGKVIANGATNIIPNEVKLEGTFRTFDENWRKEAHQLMKNMAENIAKSMGGSCDLDIHVGYPFLVNEEKLTLKSMDLAKDFLGQDKVVDLSLRMTAEDFSYYSQHMPGCFYRLGTNQNNSSFKSSLHTPTFDVDETSLEVGMGLMAWLVFNA
jgi:amidohydrolase